MGDSFQSLQLQSPSSAQDVLLTITNDCAILLNNSGELGTILICCNRDHEQCSNLAWKATNLLSCYLDIHIIRKCCKHLLKCCPASNSALGRNSATQPKLLLSSFCLSGVTVQPVHIIKWSYQTFISRHPNMDAFLWLLLTSSPPRLSHSVSRLRSLFQNKSMYDTYIKHSMTRMTAVKKPIHKAFCSLAAVLVFIHTHMHTHRHTDTCHPFIVSSEMQT